MHVVCNCSICLYLFCICICVCICICTHVCRCMCICIQYTYSKSAATQSQLWRQLPEAAPTVTKTSTPLPEVITVHGVGFPQDVDKAPDVKSELPWCCFASWPATSNRKPLTLSRGWNTGFPQAHIVLDQIGPCEVPDGMASGNVVHLQGQSLQQVSEDQGSAVSGSLTVQSSFVGHSFCPGLACLKGSRAQAQMFGMFRTLLEPLAEAPSGRACESSVCIRIAGRLGPPR